MRFGARFSGDGRSVRRGYVLSGNELQLVQSQKDLGVLIDSSLKFHLHIFAAAGKAAGLDNQILRSTFHWSCSFMVSNFISHIRPILDYCSTFWNSGYVGDSHIPYGHLPAVSSSAVNLHQTAWFRFYLWNGRYMYCIVWFYSEGYWGKAPIRELRKLINQKIVNTI